MDAEYFFNLISPSVLTTVGIAGNLLVIIILTQKKFRMVSLFRYLIVATCLDIINLLLMWPSNQYSIFKLNKISIWCKSYVYLTNLVCEFSLWINVVSSIDRLISFKYPKRFSFLKTFKYQFLILFILFLILLLLNIPFIVYLDVREIENYTYCTYDPLNMSIGFYLDIFNSLLTTLIPAFILILSASLIGHDLIKNKKKLNSGRKNLKKELHFLKTMFAMNTFYLVPVTVNPVKNRSVIS